MILVNGDPAETVNALDRGLAYGDGVLRTEAGQPLWWRDQYETVAADCAALMLACPTSLIARRSLPGRPRPGGVAKIVITRAPVRAAMRRPRISPARAS
jgi:4-amino-4-deoxychorismate lyase